MLRDGGLPQAPVIGLPLGGSVSPVVLLYGLTAALVARMESMPTALLAGIAIGVIEQASFVGTNKPDLAAALLLPLVLLLHLTLSFPDRAPSRISVALRANRAHRLQRMVERGEPLPASTWDEIGLAQRETFSDHRHLIIYGQRTADDRLVFGGRGAPYHLGSRIRPQFDLEPKVFAGLHATLLELFPVVPIIGNVTLDVGVLSYAGQLNLTAMADQDSCPDLEVFTQGVRGALDALANSTLAPTP